MLLFAIHNRYEERSSLLAVSSVTANIRVSTSAGFQTGFGDSVGNNEDYEGNLVPFSAGVVYEENPTISYTPVDGENYMRSLMSPVSVANVAQIVTTMSDPAPSIAALVSRVNNISNPDFRHSRIESDPRFDRFVTIVTELRRARRLYWIADPEQKDRLSIFIDQYTPAYVTEVNELMGLLGLAPPKDTSSKVILPVFLSHEVQDESGVAILTRSVFDLMEIFSAAIMVPEEDEQDGVVKTYPPAGSVGERLRIHYSEDRPERSYVEVKYRGGWFYIDERDQTTKRFFRLMTNLWSVAIAESTKNRSSPVLTVPVSR